MASRQELQDDAVAKLKRFIPGTSKINYINYLLAGGVDGAANTGNSPTGLEGIDKALDPIVNLINGGKFLHEILGDLEVAMAAKDPGAIKNNKKIASFVRITPSVAIKEAMFTEGKFEDGNLVYNGVINSDQSFAKGAKKTDNWNDSIYYIKIPESKDITPSKTNTSLVAIEMLNPKIGIMVRDTQALQVFCSMIPTHAISRAVPYVSAKIYTPHMVSSDGSETKTESLNLIRYLKGNVTYKKEDTLGAMILSMTGSDKGVGFGPTKGGMELFTAPQTLVYDPTDITNQFGSYAPIDRFRPLMTLNDVSFDVVSAGAGIMSYKNASMNITLHDRGRLAEITPLVKPGMYSFVEVELEYGWSADPRSANATGKPGTLTGFATQDDVFTQFVDSLRVKEKYQVVNSTFKFDDVGQVNISITLAMKGSSDIKSYDISNNDMKDQEKNIKQLVEEIQSLLAKNGEQAQTLFGETLINAIASPEAALSLDNKALTAVRTAITKLKANSEKKSESFQELNTRLSTLFNGNQITQFKAGSESAITTALSKLREEQEIFPASKNIYLSPNNEFSKAEKTLLGTDEFKQISLGRVLLAFVGAPLAKSGQYDEIQLIFNKINNRAGFVRGLSTAAFPLDSAKLETTFKKLYSKNLSVSISTLIGVIGDSQFNDPAHKAYGHSSAYNKKGELKENQQTAIDTKLAAAGIYDLNFQLPSLQVSIECVAHVNDPTKTILRIHVMDGACTPHQTYAEAINSARTDSTFFVDAYSLSVDNKLFPSNDGVYQHDIDPVAIAAERVEDINKMIKSEVLKPVSVKINKIDNLAQSATYKLDLAQLFTVKDPKIAKKFLSEALPTLRFGGAAGMIKNISLSSIADPALTTINIMKMDDTANNNEGIAREKGLPLLISPTEVSVDMLGCPIINFGQSVYIDFGTNTSADNIYACTGLSHKLAPGEFSTSAKFTLNVGAYGIYNSSKRMFDITMARVNDAASGVGALSSTFLESMLGAIKGYKWKTDCFKDLTSKDLLANAKKVSNGFGALWSNETGTIIIGNEPETEIGNKLKEYPTSTFVFMQIPTIDISAKFIVGYEDTLVNNEQIKNDVLIDISGWIEENKEVVAKNKAAAAAARAKRAKQAASDAENAAFLAELDAAEAAEAAAALKAAEKRKAYAVEVAYKEAVRRARPPEGKMNTVEAELAGQAARAEMAAVPVSAF